MSFTFFKYFVSYVFKGQTRQKLIFLTIIGLLISSFSLMVLQGVMGGLQKGLVKRSKNVLGTGYFDVSKLSQEEVTFIANDLKYKKIEFMQELEIELMLQHGKYLAPVILHGFDFSNYVPMFLQNKDRSGLILGGKIARELGAYFESIIKVTSPAHTSVFFRELPRQSSIKVTDFYSSELPEIDGIHGWSSIQFLQNMIRKRKVNKIRVFSPKEEVAAFLKLASKKYQRFIYWEDQNATLVWALNLETKVMLFLFTMMSILIGICIVSGYLIFFNKIKVDLASFWILGLPKEKALKLIHMFGHLLTGFFSGLGVLIGLGLLVLLDSNQLTIMPEHFVERNVPVNITLTAVLISFTVPYLVAYIFTRMTFKIFKKEGISFLSLIKRVG